MSADMQSSLSATEEAAAAAADASIASWGDFGDAVEADISAAATAAQGDFEGMSSAALAAADAASAAWQGSVGELNTDLAELPAAAATAGAEAGAELSGGLESSISSLGGKLMAGSAFLGIAGAALSGGVGAAIGQAADQQEALSNSTQELTNLVAANSNGFSANATQIGDLTAKIQTYQAEIASAQAGLLQWNGTTAEVNATHEKDTAEIATATAAMQPYQQQLEALINTQGLGSQSAQSLLESYIGLASNGTDLLYSSFNDSLSALVTFTNEMGAGQTTTLAYNDALALLASGKVSDMSTAVQDVTQAFQGQGRALQQIIPALKDGAGGATALNDIWAYLGTTVQKNAADLAPQMAGLANNSAMLGAAMGTDLQPGLTSATQGANTLLQKLTQFSTDYPGISAAFLSIAGGVGALATALGSIGFGAGVLLMLGEAFDRIAEVGIGTAFSTALKPITALFGGIQDIFAALIAGDPVTLAIAAAFIAVATAIVLIITHWPQVQQFLDYVMNSTGAIGIFKSMWSDIATIFDTMVKPALQQLLQELQPVMPYLQQMAEIFGGALLISIGIIVALILGFIIACSLLLAVLVKIVDFIVGMWMGAWNEVTTVIQNVISWFDQLPAAVQKAVQGAVSFFQPLISAFQTAWNFVNEIMNALKGPVGSVISSISGGISGALKAFASGGIVNSPTLALVGEAGPEAIIPLSAFSGGSGLASAGAGGGGNIIVNINGGSYLNQGGAQQIAQALATMIQQQIKLKVR